MPTSAGLLVHRETGSGVEFLLGHPGGPLWRARDLGAWTIPKGAVEGGETSFEAALREFTEETGLVVSGAFRELKPIRQAGGKHVHCWSVEADLDLTGFRPGTFEMVWPPRSGQMKAFPELDRLAYFAETEALIRVLPSQIPLIRQVLNGDR